MSPEKTPPRPPRDAESTAPNHAWVRRGEIRRQVSERGFVRLDDLARSLGVSQMTIHRDLADLEARGYLHKVRGGATSEATRSFHGDLDHRRESQDAAKQALGRAAAELVEPGQVVFIDDSTTCLHLASLLLERAPLTVVSNFLPVIQLLGSHPGIEVVGVGGRFDGARQAFLGATTAAMVERFRGDILFMSTTAVTDGKCFHHSPDTVLVKQALMAVAAQRVLLVDHTKFARRGTHYLADLTAFDRVFVDSGIPAAALERLTAANVRVTVVPADS